MDPYDDYKCDKTSVRMYYTNLLQATKYLHNVMKYLRVCIRSLAYGLFYSSTENTYLLDVSI